MGVRMGCGVSVQCDCALCRASRPVELLVVEQVPMPSSVGALIECRYCHGALPTVRMRGIVPDGEGGEGVYLCAECWADVQVAMKGGRA